MNELSAYIIHALLATILALAPLSVAAYFDVRAKREASRTTNRF